jgi:hypothetical protein
MDTEGGSPVTATAKVPIGIEILGCFDRTMVGKMWIFFPDFADVRGPVLFLFGGFGDAGKVGFKVRKRSWP